MQIHDLNTGTPVATDVLAMDTGSDTYKTTPGNVVPSYTSGDSSTATSWTSVTAVSTGLSFSTLINRITTMMKNVRYLYNILGSSTFSTVASTVTGAIGNTALGTTATTLSGAIAEHESDIGNTDISSIGNGTVTGAISKLNSNINKTSVVKKNIAANSTLAVTVPNNYRGIAFTCASPAAVMSVWGIMAASNGGVTARQIVAAGSTNNLTASAGTNAVTFTNPQSVGVSMMFLNISDENVP